MKTKIWKAKVIPQPEFSSLENAYVAHVDAYWGNKFAEHLSIADAALNLLGRTALAEAINLPGVGPDDVRGSLETLWFAREPALLMEEEWQRDNRNAEALAVVAHGYRATRKPASGKAAKKAALCTRVLDEEPRARRRVRDDEDRRSKPGNRIEGLVHQQIEKTLTEQGLKVSARQVRLILSRKLR